MPEKRFEMASTISKTINSGKKIDAKHCNCVYIAGNDITIGVRDFATVKASGHFQCHNVFFKSQQDFCSVKTPVKRKAIQITSFMSLGMLCLNLQ